MLTHFFHMGGYALYVWLSYGVFAIVFLANMGCAYQKKRSAWRYLLQNRIKKRDVV
jgi:heme exporter protein CcmD